MSWSFTGFIAIVGLTFIAWFLLVVLFAPRLDYRIPVPLRPESDEFLYVLEHICQAAVHPHNRVEILRNGTQFYPAMRDAILAAQSTINLEAYILQPGEAADMLIDAMMERARHGVEIRLVLDWVGSLRFSRGHIRRLERVGFQIGVYQPVTWHRLHRLNNRTHREILIVDGRVAFTGGAGVADWWLTRTRRTPAWRDTMARIEGPIVSALQGVFAENWLECRGEILSGPRHWPPLQPAGDSEAMLVKSSPADRSTVSRVFFQMSVEGAVRSIDISTPYLLPDRSLRQAFARAARRGVAVRLLVPGPVTDQHFVRLASRRMYRELLESGVRIYEYRPAMTHVKALIVDGVWAVVGTTNVDNRSFEHNDEVNVAFRDRTVADRMSRDFEADLVDSDEVTLERWQARSALEKIVGPVCWILERQQ